MKHVEFDTNKLPPVEGQLELSAIDWLYKLSEIYDSITHNDTMKTVADLLLLIIWDMAGIIFDMKVSVFSNDSMTCSACGAINVLVFAKFDGELTLEGCHCPNQCFSDKEV